MPKLTKITKPIEKPLKTSGKRGRPKGSKNKPKVTIDSTQPEVIFTFKCSKGCVAKSSIKSAEFVCGVHHLVMERTSTTHK